MDSFGKSRDENHSGVQESENLTWNLVIMCVHRRPLWLKMGPSSINPGTDVWRSNYDALATTQSASRGLYIHEYWAWYYHSLCITEITYHLLCRYWIDFIIAALYGPSSSWDEDQSRPGQSGSRWRSMRISLKYSWYQSSSKKQDSGLRSDLGMSSSPLGSLETRSEFFEPLVGSNHS